MISVTCAKNQRIGVAQIGRSFSALKIAPVKRRSFPLWLLRDAPAFLGVMTSFWPLMNLVIFNGRGAASGKKVRQSVCADFAILLAHAEASSPSRSGDRPISDAVGTRAK
jgi:hypothetical protein